MRFLVNSTVAILILLLLSTSAFAKKRSKSGSHNLRVRIEQPVTNDFPNMEVFVSVTNRQHEPILSLIRGNFNAVIDGEEVTSKIDVAGFQYTEQGVSYALLIAGNGMMEGEAIEEQLKAAVVLLESLREQDELSVYVFSEEVKTVFEFQKKNESLVDKITKVEVLGGNPHLYDALVYVSRRFDSSELKRKVLITMTDGRESGSRYNKEQLYKALDEINIPVYSIGLKLMAGQNLYKISKISNHTGGDYIFARNLSSTARVMETVIRQVLLGYSLKFRASNISADNQLHQMQVKAIVKDGEASFFKNFVAEKIPMSLWVLIALSVLFVICLILFIIFYIIKLKRTRKEMGIGSRKCPDCKMRMKDDWDECLFCKYENA